MPYAIRQDLARLMSSAKVNNEGTWFCRNHPGQALTRAERRRSLWLYPMPEAGFGKVLPVLHIYCPRCQPERQTNEEGQGIYTIELIEVDDHLMPVREPENLIQLFGIPRPAGTGTTSP